MIGRCVGCNVCFEASQKWEIKYELIDIRDTIISWLHRDLQDDFQDPSSSQCH